MPKFLIDENLSPLLSDYLKTLGYNSVSVRELGLKGKPDIEVIKLALQQHRIIITADLDFGGFFYMRGQGDSGVIILRSRSQKLVSFQKIIDYLHRERVLRSKNLEGSLLIATHGKYRIRKFI